MKDRKWYSEGFKQKVVREIEMGRHGSIYEAARVYGVGGALTVYKWAKKYGKVELLGRVIRVETARETDEKKELRKSVRGLKESVADLHVALKIEEAYLEVACEGLGISVEEFKKKHGVKR
jgi:transposase-like protein